MNKKVYFVEYLTGGSSKWSLHRLNAKYTKEYAKIEVGLPQKQGYASSFFPDFLGGFEYFDSLYFTMLGKSQECYWKEVQQFFNPYLKK